MSALSPLTSAPLVQTVTAGLIVLGCSAADDVIAQPRPPAALEFIGCDVVEDPMEGTVALYRFEDNPQQSFVRDDAQTADGAVHGGTVSLVDGPEGCGHAFDFGAEGERYLVLPEDAAWQLDEGSVDFWLRAPSMVTAPMALVSRDLFRSGADNLTLWLEPGGRIIARLQHASSDGGALDSIQCSAAAVRPDSWIHIGYNFGPRASELSVDGDTSGGSGQVEIFGLDACGSGAPSGISGNNLPWVVGRSSYRSMAPLQDLEQPLVGAAIDNLRISSVSRDFSSD